jgi:hypothetical protein
LFVVHASTVSAWPRNGLPDVAAIFAKFQHLDDDIRRIDEMDGWWLRLTVTQTLPSMSRSFAQYD